MSFLSVCPCEVTFWRLEHRTESSTGLNISSSWIWALGRFCLSSVVCHAPGIWREAAVPPAPADCLSRISSTLITRNSQKPTVHTFFSCSPITSVNVSVFYIWTLCSIFLAVKSDVLITGGLFFTWSSQTFSTRANLEKAKSNQSKQFPYNLLLAETYSASINSVTSDSLALSILITPASWGDVHRAAYV